MNDKIMQFIATLLIERGYEIIYYNGPCNFHANLKENCWQNIECSDGKLHTDICLHTRGKTLEDSIEYLTKIYNNAQKDIDYVNKQLLNLTSKENIIKILKMCEVPKEIIEQIEKHQP